jgi:hypothetical protein
MQTYRYISMADQVPRKKVRTLLRCKKQEEIDHLKNIIMKQDVRISELEHLLQEKQQVIFTKERLVRQLSIESILSEQHLDEMIRETQMDANLSLRNHSLSASCD